MTGRYLLDTNFIVYAINRRIQIPHAYYGVSIITEMELLSFPRLTSDEQAKIETLLSHFVILGISEEIKERAIRIRRASGLKLPDSVISATALEHDCSLVTNDAKLASIHPGSTLTFEQFTNQ